ncbi:MAG TPA: monovalent cation/H(+) antiporter subunit G [Frankiaceae bacterium]|nr:monovalent cation/H(+) antiporter subunit G [Frankiaceae bacterium]
MTAPLDSIRGVVVAVLLTLGTVTVLISCVAVLRLPGLPAQLHGLAPAGTLGAPLVCLGIAVDEGIGRSAGKVLITALILLVTGPVAATVTSRTALNSDDPPPEFVLAQDERTAP